MNNTNMNKRKYEYDINYNTHELASNNYKIYNSYNNPLNCDNIILYNNHIYFNALINEDCIKILIQYINTIITHYHLINDNNDKSIYIHINCKGGYIKNLMEFLEFKKSCSIELISIIEQECVDCGIMFAALCDYRIINKNAVCKLSCYNNGGSCPYFWNYFMQCNNNALEIDSLKKFMYSILCDVIDSNITSDKLEKYFEQNNVWNAKKYKKLRLADEIV